MPAKRYKVDLRKVERAELDSLTRKGEVSAREMKRAPILLKASEGWRAAAIAEALNTAHSTAERVRQRFVEGS